MMVATDVSPLVALDLESILVPEMWPAVAAHVGVPELARTTRDTDDFPSLMARRIEVCRQRGLTLRRLRSVVADLEPLPGALEFLAWARIRFPVAIVSDTSYELAEPLLEMLGWPMLLCHGLDVDSDGFITAVRLRQRQAKGCVARAFRQMGYWVVAVGDSYNDLQMLHHADMPVLLNPPVELVAQYPRLPRRSTLKEIQELLQEELACLTSNHPQFI